MLLFQFRHGDWVQFRIATDTRDQLQRASDIALLPESFAVSGERREQGVIAALKDGYGFIRCVEREARVFFHFNEVLDVDREISVNDEVEFTIIQVKLTLIAKKDSFCCAEDNFRFQDPSSLFTNTRMSAIRLKHLPTGSVQFETIIETNILGTVIKDTNGNDPGLIEYCLKDGIDKNIIFFAKDCNSKQIPKLNDKVCVSP